MYYRQQAHNKPLYVLLITGTNNIYIWHYKSCHHTIKECYVITVLDFYLIDIEFSKLEHNFFFLECNTTQYMYSPKTSFNTTQYIYSTKTALKPAKCICMILPRVQCSYSTLLWSIFYSFFSISLLRILLNPAVNHAAQDHAATRALTDCTPLQISVLI